MLESGEPATEETVKHLDRCLSCLSCMTTCPSGVHYMHLIDEARAHVEETYRRPLFERLLRNVLAYAMPRPALFRLSLIGAKLASPLAPVAKSFGATRIAALLGLVPKPMPTPERFGQPGTYPATGEKKGRVALLMGCVQSVLDPGINAATIRLLTRLGFEVVVSGEEACCGSLTHHMGKEEDALARARRSVDQWTKADVDACDRHRVGLRHHDQGLWPHAAPRSGLCGEGEGDQRQGEGRHRVPDRRWTCRRPKAASGSPIIPPAPCSMARRSRRSPRSCCAARASA